MLSPCHETEQGISNRAHNFRFICL